MEIKPSASSRQPVRRFLLFVYLSLIFHLYLLLALQQVLDPRILEQLTQDPDLRPLPSLENIIVDTVTWTEEIPEEGVISDKANLDAGPAGEKDYNVLNPAMQPPRSVPDNQTPPDSRSEEAQPVPRKAEPEQKTGDPTTAFYDPSREIDVRMDNQGQISLATVPQEYAEYFLNMSREISQNWQTFFPVFQYYQGIIRSGEVVVQFEVDRKGDVSGTRVVKSQGYRGLDASCVNAVNYSRNFGPLPPELTDRGSVSINFRFVYVNQ